MACLIATSGGKLLKLFSIVVIVPSKPGISPGTMRSIRARILLRLSSPPILAMPLPPLVHSH